MDTAYLNDEIKYGGECLEAALKLDPLMLGEEARQNGASLLLSVGRACSRGAKPSELPEFTARQLVDALRYAGNRVLGLDDAAAAAAWEADMRSEFMRDYAESFACGLIDELMAHRDIEIGARVYFDALTEDDDWREPLERELANFRVIAKAYEDKIEANPDCIRALTWAYRFTNFVKNLRALLPEGAKVPWYIDPVWYENYGIKRKDGVNRGD